MSLRLIGGGPPADDAPYFVGQEPEEDGGGWCVIFRLNEIARVDFGDQGGVRTTLIDRPVEGPVDDKAAAEAFCTALNARWLKDRAEEASL